MLTGGDGYSAFGKGRVLIGPTDGKLLANEVMALRAPARAPSIRKVGGRIVIR